MSLKSLLNSKSLEESSDDSRGPTIGRIIRTMKLASFDFSEPGDYSEFESFLDKIDHSDIVHCQFSTDLKKVKIIYTAEIKRIPRKEFDAQLAVEEEPSTTTKPPDDLFS